MNKGVNVIIISRRIIMYMAIGFLFILFLFFFNQHKGSLLTWGSSLLKQDEGKVTINAKASIIIDDFGNQNGGALEMLALNIPLTCAVIPFLEESGYYSELAYEAGHEVIVHLPMEPHFGNAKWLGERGITSKLSTEAIKEIVRDAIDSVPHAVGLNNHMGSKATEDRRIVEAIVQVLKEKEMFIIDSKTSMNSVIREVAEMNGVKVLERSVFLDNEKSITQIKKQLRILAKLAKETEMAVAIGHVGPEGGTITAQSIREMQAEIEEMGVTFVKVSDLLMDENLGLKKTRSFK